MSPRKHETELEGVAEALARGGDAIVATERGRVFVRGALPGDRVLIGALRKDRGHLHGELRAVLAPGSGRVTPACPLSDRCGGCPWMALEAGAQGEAKRAFLESALPEGVRAEGLVIGFVPAPERLGYRRRARLHFDGGSGAMGFLGSRSHAVVDAPACLVLAPRLAEAWSELRPRLGPALAGRGTIGLALGAEGRPVVALRSERAQSAEVFRVLEALVAEGHLAGASLEAGGASRPATFGDPRERTRTVDGLALEATVGGFSQAQDAMNDALVAYVAELAHTEGEAVLELYAGHGNLTSTLARGAGSYVAVELDADACAAAERNARALGLPVRVVKADAAHPPAGRDEVIVLDPPRTGAAEAVPHLVARRPRRVVYVSCDTATLGRDVRAFAEAGYRVDAASAFDMFPGTQHVESVVRLVPNAGTAAIPGL